MESAIQSSFIPKDAGKPQQSRTRSGGGGGIADLLLVLAIIAFVASVALAVAVFLYQQYLMTSAQSDVSQLDRAKQEFEPTLVQQLIRLDDRMTAAQTILGTHIAPSVFFDILNQLTLKTISYSSLEFDAPDPQHITIKMDGVAQSVNSIALESDLMASSSVMTNPIFSNIDREKDGVHFSMTAIINPAALNYEKLAGGAAAQMTQVLPPSQDAAPASTSTAQQSATPAQSASTTPQTQQ